MTLTCTFSNIGTSFCIHIIMTTYIMFFVKAFCKWYIWPWLWLVADETFWTHELLWNYAPVSLKRQLLWYLFFEFVFNYVAVGKSQKNHTVHSVFFSNIKISTFKSKYEVTIVASCVYK